MAGRPGIVMSIFLTLATGSGVDNSTAILFQTIYQLQQTGPAPTLRAELARASVSLGAQVSANGALGTRLRMGVHGCNVPSRCPLDAETAARSLAHHLNAPPLVREWIEVFDASLEVGSAPVPMLGFGAADDGVAEVYFRRSSHSEEYPNLPITRGLTLPALLRAANLSTGLAVAEVALVWSVKQPESGVRVRIYHSEPSVVAALGHWGTYHNVTRERLSVWAAELARAAPRAQLIWTSPLYEPLTRTEPPRLFPSTIAIKASMMPVEDASGDHKSPPAGEHACA